MDGSFTDCNVLNDRSFIAVLLLDGFSSLSLGAIMEPFAMARSEFPGHLPEMRLVGFTDRCVRSASGMEVMCGLDAETVLEKMFGPCGPQSMIICGPTDTPYKRDKRLIDLLRKVSRSGTHICGIGNVTWAMAEAGLLGNSGATVHWKSLAVFQEANPSTDTRNALFVTNGSVGTCAGELATLDMIIQLISVNAPQAVRKVMNRLLISQPRLGSSLQPGSQCERLRHLPPILSQAAKTMAENIEYPLSTSEIAGRCNCSLRQIERLFRKYLNSTPKQYYDSLKVERAIELISQTDLPLREVALASGFQALATLAKKLKQIHGKTPNEIRDLLARSEFGKLLEA